MYLLESDMHFHFHVLSGQSIEYDSEGAHFDTMEAARSFGLELIRNYFLIHPRPRPEVLAKSVLCIASPDGHIEPVPFLDAFRLNSDEPIVYCTPGNA